MEGRAKAVDAREPWNRGAAVHGRPLRRLAIAATGLFFAKGLMWLALLIGCAKWF